MAAMEIPSSSLASALFPTGAASGTIKPTYSAGFQRIKFMEDAQRVLFAAGRGKSAACYYPLIELDQEKQDILRGKIAAAILANGLKRGPQLRSIYPRKENLVLQRRFERLTNPSSAEPLSAPSLSWSLIQALPIVLKEKVVLAGGAVVDMLMGCSSREVNDWDLFVLADNQKSARHTLKDLLAHFERHVHQVIRTKRSVTLKLRKDEGGTNNTVQIILRAYSCLEEILVGFDLDASGCAFHQGKYLCTKRAYKALAGMKLRVDISRLSTSYNCRLLKYAVMKFFSICIPVPVTSEHWERVVQKVHLNGKHNLCYPWTNTTLVGLLTLEVVGRGKSSGFRRFSSDYEIVAGKIQSQVTAYQQELEDLEQRFSSSFVITGGTTGERYVLMRNATKAYKKELKQLSQKYPDRKGRPKGISLISEYVMGKGFQVGGYTYSTFTGLPVKLAADITCFKDKKIFNTHNGFAMKKPLEFPLKAEFLMENPGTQWTSSFQPVEINWDTWARTDHLDWNHS